MTFDNLLAWNEQLDLLEAVTRLANYRIRHRDGRYRVTRYDGERERRIGERPTLIEAKQLAETFYRTGRADG